MCTGGPFKLGHWKFSGHLRGRARRGVFRRLCIGDTSIWPVVRAGIRAGMGGPGVGLLCSSAIPYSIL